MLLRHQTPLSPSYLSQGVLVDFSWTEEQEELHRAVVAFARAELESSTRNGAGASDDLRRRWAKCAQFGILGLPFAQEYGGLDAGPLSAALAMEALGFGCQDAGLVFALSAQMWSVQMPLSRFGSEQQKRLYLSRLCSGEIIGGHAMSEPHSGSDAFSLRTTATRDGRFYVLNGTKTFVTNAPFADLFVIFATTDASQGFFGVTGFILERETSGLTVGPPLEKMGLQTAQMAEVYLTDCMVDESCRLGPEGQGAQIFRDSMDWERSMILAGQVGAMARQLEQAVEYAQARRQFGKPIGKFQAVSHKLADMKVRLETCRLLLYKAAWLKQRGEQSEAASALAKLYISEAAVLSALDAIQVRGGYGYMSECDVEVALRDAVGGRIFSGTSEIMRNIIAYDLGL
jgi:alkylation response protein AidB-like acyl-CoA dehydrogenase